MKISGIGCQNLVVLAVENYGEAGMLEADTIVQVLLRDRLRVTALAAAVIRDVHAADDIFQQVVLAALEARSQFRDTDHVLAWSFRAARHRALDLARSRHLHSLPDEVLDLLESRWTDPAATSAVAGTDRGEALHRCMNRLGTPARELLQMKYADGLTAVAIADKLRRTANAVYQNLCRIHRSLRECVERELAGRASKPRGASS
jgi:RNA polymerase sigma-70 factor (ECF subfamily)